MHQMKSLSWFDFNIMVPVNNHLTSWKKSITTATLKEVIILLAPFTFASQNVFFDNDRFIGNIKGRKEKRQVTRNEPAL